MRLPLREIALSLLLFTGVACVHPPPIPKVLEAYRDTPAFLKARESFKTILRKYAHSGLESATDEEMNRYFEQFLALDRRDVERFMKGQACMPRPGTVATTYYLVHASHTRHDGFFATDQPIPVTGTGTKGLTASFSGSLLFQRYALNALATMPKRAAAGPFPTWASLQTAMTDRSTFDSTFKLRDPAQAQSIFAVTSAVDWSQAQAQVFMAPDMADGAVFSPALFAVYLFRPTPQAPYGFYLVVSASGGGQAKQPFIGLIPQPGLYKSTAGFAFTYLSNADNLLDYSVEVVNPVSGETKVTINTAFPGHPDSPYLTVHASLLPAPDDVSVEAYTKVPGLNVLMMVRKAALMRDLIEAYYPNSSELQLWKDVGAITGDPSLKADLEAAGLNLAVDLLAKGVWTRPPTVRDSLNVDEVNEPTCAPL